MNRVAAHVLSANGAPQLCRGGPAVAPNLYESATKIAGKPKIACNNFRTLSEFPKEKGGALYPTPLPRHLWSAHIRSNPPRP